MFTTGKMTGATLLEDKENLIDELKQPGRPNKLSIVHIAQVHKSRNVSMINKPSRVFNHATFNWTAFSQFNVAKTIIANPEAMVFTEGLTKDVSENFFPSSYLKIQDDFPLSKGFPRTYDELTIKQKNCLILKGAPRVLFSLGLLKHIYKTDTRNEIIKQEDFLAKIAQKKTTYTIAEYNQVIIDVIFDRREERALRLINEVAQKSNGKNSVALLIYGAAHKFGEKIKKMECLSHIVYEGRVCTESSIDSTLISKSAEKILPCGKLITSSKQSISIENFRRIIEFYRTKYSSTSIFKNGYRSKAIRSLVNFLDKVEKNGLKEITYMSILEILAREDESRAKLFRGEYPESHKITTATDKIIFDLRMAFETIPSLISSKDSSQSKKTDEEKSAYLSI